MQTIIQPKQLLLLLEDELPEEPEVKSLKILFTSMIKAPASKPDIVQSNDAYIPQSIYFDFETCFVDGNSALEHMMPPVAVFENEIAKLGLEMDDEIVIYDDFGNFCASRVWFMLTSMGFSKVRVLQGGLPTWLELAYPTQATLTSPKPSIVKVNLQVNRLMKFVDSDFMLSIINKRSGFERIQIVDARSVGRFEGTETEPRANMRSGHMPGASNLHYARLLEHGMFKEKYVLQDMFVEAGVDLNLPIVTSCGSGVTACILAQAYYELGNREIYVYDGSWSEWGASDSFPIEKL
ncbi:MAG: sulfurtransferase [Glaciecola sp.]|jgi:thiosulfate/3-mercaptopyruvate sulfurtransferase